MTWTPTVWSNIIRVPRARAHAHAQTIDTPRQLTISNVAFTVLTIRRRHFAKFSSPESLKHISFRARRAFSTIKKLISMFLISWRVASLIGTVGQKFICIFFYWNLIINASFPTRELFLSNFVERANEGSLCSRVERGEPRINDLYVVYSNAKIVAEFLFFF